MIPPIFKILKSSNAITDLFGVDFLRVFKAGDVPANENLLRPFIVFQVITATPENYLDGISDIDSVLLQVDVYADDSNTVLNAFNEVRFVLENYADVQSMVDMGIEADTKLYRMKMDLNWWLTR